MDGRDIRVEVEKTSDKNIIELGKEVLEHSSRWRDFVRDNKLTVPYEDLSDEYKLLAIRALFPKDASSPDEWVHVVTFADAAQGRETLWQIATWFTGRGTTCGAIKQHNDLRADTIYHGQKIKIARSLLLPPFVESASPVSEDGELVFKRDSKGEYAAYKLKKGESVHGNVVPHFTDMVDEKDVLWASRQIIKRSGIRDPEKIPAGAEVKIPTDLLSTKYRPPSDPNRASYEAFEAETEKYQPEQKAKGLAGVAVILDAGHGGEDPGTIGKLDTHEDDYVYDIMCRVKRLLEQKTQACVYVTIVDQSTKYSVLDVTEFDMDKDEFLLTTPQYSNANPGISANLRWYLANSIYRRLLREGFDKEKIVFSSFHADSLYSSLRGLMVYVPSAHHCDGKNSNNGLEYARYKEVQEKPTVRSSLTQRRRSEMVSRSFASQLIMGFHRKSLRVHNEPPVRGYVVRDRRIYVPAILRHNEIPVKVLVEVVNLNNLTDCKLLRSPEFRERVAEAYVETLQKFYE